VVLLARLTTWATRKQALTSAFGPAL